MEIKLFLYETNFFMNIVNAIRKVGGHDQTFTSPSVDEVTQFK